MVEVPDEEQSKHRRLRSAGAWSFPRATESVALRTMNQLAHLAGKRKHRQLVKDGLRFVDSLNFRSYLPSQGYFESFSLDLVNGEGHEGDSALERT
jgi:hypothetical protein